VAKATGDFLAGGAADYSTGTTIDVNDAPADIVVGADARAVARFVSQYAGRGAPKVVGLVPCSQQPIGTLPLPGQTTTVSSSTSSSSQVAVPGTQVKAGPHSATAQGTHKTQRKK